MPLFGTALEVFFFNVFIKVESRQIIFYFFYFIFYCLFFFIVLVLPNIKMNPPQVYMCSPS